MKKFTLPKEWAEKWFEELLSGKYQQGASQLAFKRGGIYCCCLGVAGICNIEDKEEFIEAVGGLGFPASLSSKDLDKYYAKYPFEQMNKPIKDLEGFEELKDYTSNQSGLKNEGIISLENIYAALNDGESWKIEWNSDKNVYERVTNWESFTFKEIVKWTKRNVDLV